MEENLERGPIIPQPSSDECIIAAKVYGKCRQQDCLRPDFVEPEPGVDSIPITGSLSGEAVNVISIGGTVLTNPIAPDNPIIFPLNIVKYGRVVDGTIRVTSMQLSTEQEQNLLSADGYWKVTIRYQFNYKLELVGNAGTALPVQLAGAATTQNFICAYSIYEKQLVLFGGAGNPNIYIASNLFANNGPYTYQNAPYVAVQAKATQLAVNLGTYVDPCPVDPAVCPENIIGVTIGLFTIIKLFRLVTMNVRTTGNCAIPLCDPILPGDPCSFFNELPFPFDDFDPPTS